MCDSQFSLAEGQSQPLSPEDKDIDQSQWDTLIELIEEEVKGLEPALDDPEYQEKAETAKDLIALGLDLIADGFNIHNSMIPSNLDYAMLWELQEKHVATVMKICTLTRERLFDFEAFEVSKDDPDDDPEKLRAYREFFDSLGVLSAKYFAGAAQFE